MSIRLRLAFWYTGLLAVMVLVFAPVVYLTLENELLNEVDRQLAPLGQHAMLTLAGGDLARLMLARGSDLDPFASEGVGIVLLDASGKALARSSNLQDRTARVTDRAFGTAWSGSSTGFNTSLEGTRYRGYLVPVSGRLEPRGFVLVLRSLEAIDDTLARVRNLLIIGNIIGLVLAVGISWVIAQNGLRPIEEITQTARFIAQSRDFGKRLKAGGGRDEVGTLAVTFNEMLASLDSAYAAQRRFVSDASHELRSPLTSIRSNIDVLRRALDAPREDRAEALADVASEVDRLSRMTSDLLLLARADSGHQMEMEPVALHEVARQAVRQMEGRAQGLDLKTGRLDPCLVEGNETWLKQLVLILLDNSLKYTPRGGRVEVSVAADGTNALLSVSDTGIGIAPGDLPHVFERFYRADKARTRDEGGIGLGLSVANWISQEHDGVMSVRSAQEDGTTFSLRIPTLKPE